MGASEFENFGTRELRNVFKVIPIVGPYSLFTTACYNHIIIKKIHRHVDLWPQIRICGYRLQSVPKLQICSRRYKSEATVSKYFHFSDVLLKAPYVTLNRYFIYFLKSVYTPVSYNMGYKRIERAAKRLFLGAEHRGLQFINSVKTNQKCYIYFYLFLSIFISFSPYKK